MTTPYRVAILTASDRAFRGERPDASGPALKTCVDALPAEVVLYRVLPDERALLREAMIECADRLHCDLVLTTGGTGLGLRDHTPEATWDVIEKEVPGIAELVRRAGLRQTKFAILSRAVAGIRGKTLIINLPGSPEAIQNAFEVLASVLKHACDLIRGHVHDCQASKTEEHEHPHKHEWKHPSPQLVHSLSSHS